MRAVVSERPTGTYIEVRTDAPANPVVGQIWIEVTP
jgi:hypothetical protein